jgi:hypothetical protein
MWLRSMMVSKAPCQPKKGLAQSERKRSCGEADCRLRRVVGPPYRRMGFAWSREPRTPMGVREGETRARHRCMGSEGIYVLFQDWSVVYVGKTGDQPLGRRLKQHRVDDVAGRWDRFSWFGVRNINSDGSLGATPLPSRQVRAKEVIDTLEAVSNQSHDAITESPPREHPRSQAAHPTCAASKTYAGVLGGHRDQAHRDPSSRTAIQRLLTRSPNAALTLHAKQSERLRRSQRGSWR